MPLTIEGVEVAVLIESQPDRVRSIETWLWGESVPRSAVLIDFVPVSSGAASSGYAVGDRLDAEFVFYRSSVPLRAQIAAVARGAQSSADPLRVPNRTLDESYSEYERALARLPWLGTFTLSFRKASVRRKDDALYLCDASPAWRCPCTPPGTPTRWH